VYSDYTRTVFNGGKKNKRKDDKEGKGGVNKGGLGGDLKYREGR